jgi:phosphatidylglycerophosphate synthase
MSKLTLENKFIDFSDYGRPIANFIAEKLKTTPVTAVHLTLLFVVSGAMAIYSITLASYWAAAFFLILKSILDAADGQLARAKNQPSFIGRYLDSIFDALLNIALLCTIGWLTKTNIAWILCSFICMQVQGTIYNYYHVILRHKTEGEITSQIFEGTVPKAYPEESQAMVNFLFNIFRFLYRGFDELVYRLDPSAQRAGSIPKWFMALVSLYGLGFQLLLISFFLVMGWMNIVIPFFIAYSILIPVFIGIRRICLK